MIESVARTRKRAVYGASSRRVYLILESICRFGNEAALERLKSLYREESAGSQMMMIFFAALWRVEIENEVARLEAEKKLRLKLWVVSISRDTQVPSLFGDPDPGFLQGSN
jgi:hypothetical protein